MRAFLPASSVSAGTNSRAGSERTRHGVEAASVAGHAADRFERKAQWCRREQVANRDVVQVLLGIFTTRSTVDAEAAFRGLESRLQVVEDRHATPSKVQCAVRIHLDGAGLDLPLNFPVLEDPDGTDLG